jgi:hypothetical protein
LRLSQEIHACQSLLYLAISLSWNGSHSILITVTILENLPI